MSLLDLLDSGRHERQLRLERKLDALEELLIELNIKYEDRFSAVLSGVQLVIPHEKGQFISRLEERLALIKKEMAQEAVLAECLAEPKSYPELRRRVRERTGLALSGAFMDAVLRRLAYEGRLERIGNRYRAVRRPPSLEDESEESRIAGEIRPGDNGSKPLVKVGEGPASSKIEKLGHILKIVEELERRHGSAPIDMVIRETVKSGMDEETANQLLDEHLMITGRLYEAKGGHVKLVRPAKIG